jgi:P pilus assembly chaperone PapD
MKYIVIVFLVLATFSQSVNANLLVSPTRLSFEGKDRVKELILINVTDKARSYRIEWEENTVDVRGNYKAIPDNEITFASSPFIRYSPRQVTLQPGERQVIKLMLRRKSDMHLPEYRSHLKMTALPLRIEDEESQALEGIEFKIDVLTSYTIPVIVRTQEITSSVKVKSISVRVNEANKAFFELDIEKIGPTSVTGEIEISHVDPITGEGKVVGILRGVNIFHEMQQRMVSIEWQGYSQPIMGEFRITYKGSSEQVGQILSEQTVTLTSSDFKKT